MTLAKACCNDRCNTRSSVVERGRLEEHWRSTAKVLLPLFQQNLEADRYEPDARHWNSSRDPAKYALAQLSITDCLLNVSLCGFSWEQWKLVEGQASRTRGALFINKNKIKNRKFSYGDIQRNKYCGKKTPLKTGWFWKISSRPLYKIRA